MTFDDCKKLCSLVQTYYPLWQKGVDKAITARAWFAVLKTREYIPMQKALLSFIETDTAGFPPSIGQLLERYRVLTEGQEQTPAQVWPLVLSAIRDSSYHAQERFDDLPPLAQAAIGSPEWLKGWDEGRIQEAEFRFTQNYKTAAQRGREKAVLTWQPHEGMIFLPDDERAGQIQAALTAYTGRRTGEND